MQRVVPFIAVMAWTLAGMFVGCQKPRPNLQIVNTSDSTIVVTIEGDTMSIPGKKEVWLHPGRDFVAFEFAGVATNVKMGRDENVLINPCKGLLLLHETVFKTGPDQHAQPSDYSVPIIAFSLEDQYYIGPYVMLENQLIIRGWNFGVHQPTPDSLDAPRGVPISRYKKVVTPEEILEFATPEALDDAF